MNGKDALNTPERCRDDILPEAVVYVVQVLGLLDEHDGVGGHDGLVLQPLVRLVKVHGPRLERARDAPRAVAAHRDAPHNVLACARVLTSFSHSAFHQKIKYKSKKNTVGAPSNTTRF
eukprot:9110375-Pyramimonas_sp.AAC.1